MSASIPQLAIALPRPVTALHQIELTSRCNLRCSYCPSPSIVAGKYPNRPAVDMSWQHFERALEHARFYVARGTQHELNLAGIGESTLHPQFLDMLHAARAALPNTFILLATNGLIIAEEERGEEIARVARELNIRFYVSLHRPEKAGIAVERLRRYGVLDGVSSDPSTNSDDWAGQVAWHRSYIVPLACQWIRSGRVMAMADGRLTTCCLDAQGKGVVGHVDHAPGTTLTQPYALCRGCQQQVNIRGYDQHTAAPAAPKVP